MCPPKIARLFYVAATTLIVFSFLAVASKAADSTGDLRPARLTCEYAVDPLGIDVRKPRFSWWLESDQRNQKQSAYQILVASSPEKLAKNVGDKWDSGQTESDCSLHIPYAGAPLTSRETCFWKVRVWEAGGKVSDYSPPAQFEMGLLEPADWQGKWICRVPQDASAKADDDRKEKPKRPIEPAPLLRKEFQAKAAIRRARAYISGIGYYELYLNGKKVGDHVLDPASSNYKLDPEFQMKDRVLYVTYDVTKQLKAGANAIGVILGNGWFADEGENLGRMPWGDRPQLLAQLEIEYADGSRETLVTDESWKTSASPILSNEICTGETYDARLEQAGWTSPGFDDSKWSAATLAPAVSETMSAQMLPPCRVVGNMPAVKLTEQRPGVWIFDFGQHFTGWTQLRVNGERGTTVKLRYAGVLTPEGELETRPNLRAKCTDSYTLKGDGEETWEPRFSFRGFRFVELTGFPGKPTLETLTGRHARNDIAVTGEFACSDELINKIQSNIRWTLETSFQGIPQDAAERDERVGWLGDTGFVAEDYFVNFDAASFWIKWLRDIQDTQRPDGDVPVVTPLHRGRPPAGKWKSSFYQAPDWSCTYPLFVEHLHWFHGDERVVADHYDDLCRLIASYQTKAKDNLLGSVLGDHMEPQPNGKSRFLPLHSSPELTTTCYYYRVVRILADCARLLGKQVDAEKYDNLAADIQTAFQRKYFDDAKKIYGLGGQGSLAVPLEMEIVPQEHQPTVLKNLVSDILDKHHGHLSTGIIGTRALAEALPRLGRSDVMLTICSQKTFPSWGYEIEKGATTVWETWDGDPNRCVNMKMFASVSKFFLRNLGGIQAAAPGYKQAKIQPAVVGDLKWVRSVQNTVSGRYEVDWKRGDDALDVKVTIPAGTTARVYVPTLDFKNVKVTEGGKAIWQDDKFASDVSGIMAAEKVDNAIVFNVGSGKYEFQATDRK